MRRISHGATTPLDDKSDDDKSDKEVLEELGEVGKQFDFPRATEPVVNSRFTYMFKHLADDAKCRIPKTDKTLEHLSALGEAMRDKADVSKFNPVIPSAYTYFAQFVNHDINFTDVKKDAGITDFQFFADSNLAPWSDQIISQRVSNKRGRMLELDCVYGRMQGDLLPPRGHQENPHKMALGTVSHSDSRPKGKDDFNDLVRGPMSPNLKDDRTALIGDRRNDSNIILSQLHVAFLKAHNEIIDRKRCSYEEAKQILQKHYHWLILHDFLPTIVPQEIIEEVKKEPLYDASQGLPFEFSVGAFRFGHSMVRPSYYYNEFYAPESLTRLFTPIVLCDGLYPMPGFGTPNIKANRIIRWRNFLRGEKNAARVFRTQMAEPLFNLLDEINIEAKGEYRLAVQDLKRSYIMRIPTGQAIAEQLKVKRPLTSEDLEGVSTADQFQILKEAGFLHCTPLCFYVLAEAVKADTGQLGEVGGRIVAEVLIGLLRDRPDSIIGNGWTPDPDFCFKQGTFELSDLLRLARVLEDS